MRPAEFTRPCEERTLHCLSMQGKNGPCPRTTQLSLSRILQRGDEAQQGVATGNWEKGPSGSPVRELCQSCFGENGEV